MSVFTGEILTITEKNTYQLCGYHKTENSVSWSEFFESNTIY